MSGAVVAVMGRYTLPCSAVMGTALLRCRPRLPARRAQAARPILGRRRTTDDQQATGPALTDPFASSPDVWPPLYGVAITQLGPDPKTDRRKQCLRTVRPGPDVAGAHRTGQRPEVKTNTAILLRVVDQQLRVSHWKGGLGATTTDFVISQCKRREREQIIWRPTTHPSRSRRVPGRIS